MRARNGEPRGSDRKKQPLQDDGADGRSSMVRVINALMFISIVFFLALWITGFLLLQDDVLAPTDSGSLHTELTCITFFGGLVIAIFLGAMVGNLLRRIIWKTLIRRGK